MIRTALERLSRRVIFKRRLPARFGGGQILVSPEGGLRFWRLNLGYTDPKLLDMVSELVAPGNVVWDIGANIGLFCFSAAALTGPQGRVIAIEPDTWLVDLLRCSVGLDPGKRANIDILPVAISDEIGVSEFFIANRARSTNYLKGGEDGGGIPPHGGFREKQTVMTVTLDWLLDRYPPPQVLKMDIEALEFRALKAAPRLLSTIRPIILTEVSPINIEGVTSILKSAGYTLYDADLPQKNRRPLDFAVWNTLACPK